MSDFSKVARLDRTTLVRNLKPLISSGLIEVNVFQNQMQNY